MPVYGNHPDARPAAQPGTGGGGVRYGGDGDTAVGGAPKGKRKSATLGVLEGILPVAEAVGRFSLANLIPGFSEEREAQTARLKAKVKERQQTQKAAAIPKLAASAIATAPLAMLRAPAAVIGGAEGYLTSEADDVEGRLFDAGLGAVGGEIGKRVINKAADVVSPVIDPAVRRLQARGVRMTPGQVFGGQKKYIEDLSTSNPIAARRIIDDRNRSLRDFDRGAIDEALAPVGRTLQRGSETQHEAVGGLEDLAEQRYQSILPRLTLQVDPRLMTGVRRAHQIAATLPTEAHDQFNRIMSQNMLFNANGQSYGRPLVNMVRSTRDDAYRFLKSDDENMRQLGEALMAVHEGLQGALRAQNPTLARELRATDKLYRGTRIVSDAASRAVEGESTAAQLVHATRRMDPSKNKRLSGRGRAFMQPYAQAGQKILPSKVGDSGTAPRMKLNQPFEIAAGAARRLGYEADRAMLPITSAKRPKAVEDAVDWLRRHPEVRNAIAGLGGPGVLAGMLD